MSRRDDARDAAVAQDSAVEQHQLIDFVVREDGVALVRLNRPAKRNALTGEMIAQLTEIFLQIDRRTELRAVIVTGAGAAFCAGSDIAELVALDEQSARERSARGQALCDSIELCRVPVIAAINGVAAGGGCELALACHLRVMASDARLSLPETKLGVLPAYGGTQRLARMVGARRALEIMLNERGIDAREAEACGLINRVVAPEDLLVEADKLAAEIAAHAPLAVRAVLEAVTRGVRMSFEDGLALERELFARMFTTEDAREGTRAFLEKRQAKFTGR